MIKCSTPPAGPLKLRLRAFSWLFFWLAALRKTLSKPSLFPLWKAAQRRWEKLLRQLRLPRSLRPPLARRDAESYYRAKAEQDAIHIDIAKLEADFRVGKLSKEDFAAQKSQLEAEKDALDREEDRLEDSLDLAYSQSSPALPSGSLEELRSMASELEQKEHQLEAQEDALEQSYWSGDVTRDEFIAQQIELIRTEETMDREADLLEDTLEAMGFDD